MSIIKIVKSFRFSLLYLLAFSIISTSSVNALSSKILDSFDRNGIYYYNPEPSAKCFSYTGDVTVYGNDITEKIWSGLTSFLTPAQAAAVMGNMAHEGGFNPARHDGSMLKRYQPGLDITSNSNISYGLGLIQWSYGRRVGLTQYIASHAGDELMKYLKDYNSYGNLSGTEFLAKAGASVTDRLIALELDYLKSELNSKYSGFLSTGSVEEATRYFLEQVERPKNPSLESHPERLTDANGFYNQYSNAEISPDSSVNDNCITANGQGITESGITGDGSISALLNLVMQYAWPDYYSTNSTTREAYAAAIARRQAAGLYVGGDNGIDCGGFITTLMQESGFAPDYNSGGGNTTAQENWVKSHNWTLLNQNANTPVDTSILQPGDVAFSSGHTFIYVGNLPGFNSKIASASYSSNKPRAPMAGHESLTYGKGVVVRWYRKN